MKLNYLNETNIREIIKEMYGLDNLTDDEFFSVIHSNPEFAKEVIKIMIEVIVSLKVQKLVQDEIKTIKY